MQAVRPWEGGFGQAFAIAVEIRLGSSAPSTVIGSPFRGPRASPGNLGSIAEGPRPCQYFGAISATDLPGDRLGLRTEALFEGFAGLGRWRIENQQGGDDGRRGKRKGAMQVASWRQVHRGTSELKIAKNSDIPVGEKSRTAR
jgi:hypothetical protein